VTFDDGAGKFRDRNGDGFADLYIEAGVRVSGFKFGELVFPEGSGTAHLDNPGDGHFTDVLRFTFKRRFDLRSFEIFPFGFECDDAVCPGYDNVLVTGWRDGARIARALFSMGALPSLFADPAFAGLDQLVIRTPAEPPAYALGNSHFSIDNLVITPVPLPAGLPLLAGALVLLGLSRRRRRQ
jgi:hypothetical protein